MTNPTYNPHKVLHLTVDEFKSIDDAMIKLQLTLHDIKYVQHNCDIGREVAHKLHQLNKYFRYLVGDENIMEWEIQEFKRPIAKSEQVAIAYEEEWQQKGFSSYDEWHLETYGHPAHTYEEVVELIKQFLGKYKK